MPLPPAPAAPAASPALVLGNFFGTAAEEEASSGPAWAAELEEEVREECAKFGRLLHARVDAARAGGHVFVCFEAAEAAAAARAALGGRRFAGREISAEPLPLESYMALYGAELVAAAAAAAAAGAAGGAS